MELVKEEYINLISQAGNKFNYLYILKVKLCFMECSHWMINTFYQMNMDQWSTK